MKRASKPPTPLQPSVRDDPSRASGVSAPSGPGRPPPLPSSHRSASPFVVTPRPAAWPAGASPPAADRAHDDPDAHRLPAPTIPLIPTPDVEWPAAGDPLERRPPSSHNLPTAPKRAPSDQRDPLWPSFDARANPTQTGPQLPHVQRGGVAASPIVSSRGAASPTATASGTYRTISEQRDGSVPRSDRTPAPVADDGWPLGYIVASAFFLAIAAVGFGLWLAFAVISL